MRNQVGQVVFLGSFDGADLPPAALPEVAFAGRSNVGKSSALNTLMKGRKAARVSGTPGRTQRINLFRIGAACVFADLPGYGFAKVPEAVQAGWKPMIERYLGGRDSLRLVVVLVDARREPQELDLDLVEGLVRAGIPCALVATKIDKLPKHQRKPALLALGEAYGLEGPALGFSSLTGEGVDDLWDVIEDCCR